MAESLIHPAPPKTVGLFRYDEALNLRVSAKIKGSLSLFHLRQMVL